MGTLNEGHRKKTQRTGGQTRSMGEPPSQLSRNRWTREREREADTRIDRKTDPSPSHSLRVEWGLLAWRAKHVSGHGHAEVEPHAEKPEPREDLYPRQLSHRLRHVHDVRENLLSPAPKPA